MISINLRAFYRYLPVFVLMFGAISLPVSAQTVGVVLEKLQIPPSATLEIVSGNAIHNGAQQALATLHSTQNSNSVLEFYRTLWGRGTNHSMPGYLESELPQWHLISRLRDGVNVVVQLSKNPSSDMTTGFVSARAVGEQVTATRLEGPFTELDLLSSNRTVDGVDTSSLRVYASALSSAQTHQVYRDRLVKKGWGILSDNQTYEGYVVILSREQSRLELMFMSSKEYASVLVAHSVTSK